MADEEVFVSGFRIADGMVLLDYIDPRKQSKVAGKAEQTWCDLELVEEEVTEIQELLVALVDAIELTIRNPPKRLKLGKRMVDEVDAMLPDDDGDD